jgi:predicted hotdog family 3-hydroxylacyl-ACP dehydratase
MINHETLCELIPHAGSMCLLDTVVSWSEYEITCLSESHLLAENPLRSEHKLPSVMLIEYGAQAMAVHGGLLAREQQNKLAGGYLAALRNITIIDRDVSEIKGPLRIEAKQIMAQGGSMIYEFSVSINSNNELLANGRATVIEMPDEA